MPVVAVVNRKGGSGKSTLATHLAGCLANRGLRVMLGDMDRQQSTAPWLRRRTKQALPAATPLVGWAIDAKNVMRPPSGVTHVVVDTPGAVQGLELARILMFADVVLMPLCNSAFDRESAAACLAEIRRHPRVASGRCKLATLGMRIDARTSGRERLVAWADEQGVPFIGALREAQAYVRCVERGLSIFDLPPSRVQTDLEQWQPILDWLTPWLDPASAPTSEATHPMALDAPIRTVRTKSPAPALVRAPAGATAEITGLRRWLGWLLPQSAAPRARS